MRLRAFAAGGEDRSRRIGQHFLERQVGPLPQPTRRRMAGKAGVGEQFGGERALARHEPALLPQQRGLVPGEGTLAAELLAHTGFASHSAARGLGQGAYLPLEEVLAEPPRVILAAGSERAQAHPALRSLDAPVARLDSALLYCGGPTIPRLSRRVAEARDTL